MFWYVEGKPVDEADWVRGAPFDTETGALNHREVVQKAFNLYCRWPMSTRVVAASGAVIIG